MCGPFVIYSQIHGGNKLVTKCGRFLAKTQIAVISSLKMTFGIFARKTVVVVLLWFPGQSPAAHH